MPLAELVWEILCRGKGEAGDHHGGGLGVRVLSGILRRKADGVGDQF
jgi:hypothetical protein